MKLRERIEFFLAKIAGREVDMDSITPSKASSTIEELLEEIAERIDALEEGGGQEEYVVTFTGEDGEWSADKTFAEITDAINSGKKVVADYAYYEPAQHLQMTASAEGVGYIFAGVIAGDHIEIIGIVMQSDDTIFVINGEALPSVDSNDNGKVLTVVDGEWKKQLPQAQDNNV